MPQPAGRSMRHIRPEQHQHACLPYICMAPGQTPPALPAQHSCAVQTTPCSVDLSRPSAGATQEAMPCRPGLTPVAGLVIESVEHAWDGPSLGVAAVPVEGDEGLHAAIWSPGQLVGRPPDPIPVPAGQPCVRRQAVTGSVQHAAAPRPLSDTVLPVTRMAGCCLAARDGPWACWVTSSWASPEQSPVS